MRRIESLEKTLMLGKIEGRKRRGWQRMRWLDGTIQSMEMSLSQVWEEVKDRESWCTAVYGVTKNWTCWVTEQQQNSLGKFEKPTIYHLGVSLDTDVRVHHNLLPKWFWGSFSAHHTSETVFSDAPEAKPIMRPFGVHVTQLVKISLGTYDWQEKDQNKYWIWGTNLSKWLFHKLHAGTKRAFLQYLLKNNISTKYYI